MKVCWMGFIAMYSTAETNLGSDQDAARGVDGSAGIAVCRVEKTQPLREGNPHIVVMARIVTAWAHVDYWDGKCFVPRSSTIAPLLLFLGSKRFGSLTEVCASTACLIDY